MRIAEDASLSAKKILVIEKGPKAKNDRTWCFWEKGEGYFQHLVYKSWTNLWVKHSKGEKHLDLEGYAYKMIRGIDFYKHCFDRLSKAPNVQLHYGSVQQVDAEKGLVQTDGGSFSAEHIFSSVLLDEPIAQPGTFYLLQHFRGWFIETDADAFDASKADLMNFRTDQKHGCAFVYVLPLSPRTALVEYTLFTEDVLQDNEYDDALKAFMQNELRLDNYHISEVEDGIIPMTNMQFEQRKGRVTFIGTAGGQTKASTGYTFQFIQKQSEAIVASLRQFGVAMNVNPPVRFRFYDSVLLRVLHERKVNGADVFYNLFRKNPAPRVLRFLDNASSFADEFFIMNSTPKSVFVPAAMVELGRLRQ